MKKVTVKFGDLIVSDKFTYKGIVFIKAYDHLLDGEVITNAFCPEYGMMVVIENDHVVEVEAPATFADLCVGEQFIYHSRAYAKISGHSGRDAMHGSDWHFDGDEEVQCV